MGASSYKYITTANANFRNSVKTSIYELFGVDIENPTRKREYAEARYMYYAICRDQGMCLREIGESVGKDHSTTLHGIKRCETLCDVDRDFQKNFDALQSIVRFKKTRRVSKMMSEQKSLSYMFADSLKLINELEDQIDKLQTEMIKMQIQ